MKIRFPVAVSGTAWSAQGWANYSPDRYQSDHDELMANSAREAIFEAKGSDPNCVIVHWIEVEVPTPESQTIQGKVVQVKKPEQFIHVP